MAGVVIIGVGPGIGMSVARRFGRGGMPVAAIARTRAIVDATVAAVRNEGGRAMGLIADSTDEDALRAALDGAEERYGVPDVLLYNAALVRRDRLGELSAAQLLGTLAVNVEPKEAWTPDVAYTGSGGDSAGSASSASVRSEAGNSPS